MANPDVNDVAEASAGERLNLSLAAVQDAPSAAASLRACAAAAVAAYGWRAGLILSASGDGWRVADPDGDIVAARAADRRRLRRWAETEGAQPLPPDAVLASLNQGFGPLAGARIPVPVDGAVDYALQFLAAPGFAVAPDFTETLGRVAAVAGLRVAREESAQRFADLAGWVNGTYWEMDENLRYTRRFGVEAGEGVPPAREVIGRTRWELAGADAEDEPEWRLHREQLRARRPFQGFEYEAVHDGARRRWRVAGRPVFDRQGAFRGYRGVSVDITALIEADRAANRARELLRQAIESIPQMFSLWDADDRLVLSNAHWRQLNAAIPEASQPGVSFDVHIRAVLRAGLVPQAAGREAAWFEQRMAQHRDPGAPFEVLRPGGNWTLVSELRLPDGAIVALGTDVSALKRAEAELHRARDELERRVAERTAELEAANRALRQENAERERVVAALRASEAQLRQAQKMDAMGQLTGGIAHDFNNLLTVILGSLDLLGLEVDAKSEARAYLDEARHAVAHGSLLTQHLLAFARRQALSPRPTDVNALITSFAPILQRTLGASIEVVTELDPALWPATVDRAQLENVLLNLALNARDASPSGGRIGIATGNVAIGAAEAATLDEVAAGAYVQLSMRDAGEGMAPEVLAHAVEPFFTTKEVGMGSGLGLSMVFGFVMQSQGHMRIDSAPGAGTTVTLYLPRAETPAVAADADALS